MDESELFSEQEWADLVSFLCLTRRQAEIVRLILKGQNDRRIASELKISVPTVRAHLQRAFKSLGVVDRTTLVVKVFRAFRNSDVNRKDGGKI